MLQSITLGLWHPAPPDPDSSGEELVMAIAVGEPSADIAPMLSRRSPYKTQITAS
jgi:hypothetical protein